MATLPREDCDFLREIHYKDDRTPAERAKSARAPTPRRFQRDQSKFCRDVPPVGRHERLLAVGVAIIGASRKAW